MLLAALYFSFMNSCFKFLSNDITINENVFFRGATLSIFILLMLAIQKIKTKKNKKRKYKKGGYLKLIFRGIFGVIALYSLMYNIATIPLGTTIAFSQSAPIYTAIFAFIFLKEKLNITIILSVFIGFGGVILISNPSVENLSYINIIVGIANSVFASLAFISIRATKEYFSDLFIMLSFGLITTLVGFILIELTQEMWSVISLKSWIVIFVAGIFGTLGQYYMTKSYIFAPSAIVAPIDYTRIIFSLILGIFLGDALPQFTSILGIILIITSGTLIALPRILIEIKKNAKPLKKI